MVATYLCHIEHVFLFKRELHTVGLLFVLSEAVSKVHSADLRHRSGARHVGAAAAVLLLVVVAVIVHQD